MWVPSNPKANPLMLRWAGVTNIASEGETNSISYKSKFYSNIIEDLKLLQINVGYFKFINIFADIDV